MRPYQAARSEELKLKTTLAERLAWEFLREGRLFDLTFTRQEAIRGYYVDFFCEELRLALELDGPIHQEPEQAYHDEIRDNRLREEGIVVIRIPNEWLTWELLVNCVGRHLHRRVPRGT